MEPTVRSKRGAAKTAIALDFQRWEAIKADGPALNTENWSGQFCRLGPAETRHG